MTLGFEQQNPIMHGMVAKKVDVIRLAGTVKIQHQWLIRILFPFAWMICLLRRVWLVGRFAPADPRKHEAHVCHVVSPPKKYPESFRLRFFPNIQRARPAIEPPKEQHAQVMGYRRISGYSLTCQTFASLKTGVGIQPQAMSVT